MSDSSPCAALRPRNDDVVVRHEPASAVYTIHGVSGDVEYRVSVRDQAIRLARDFARRAAVDLWYVAEGTSRLLEAYRRRAS